MSKSEAKMVSIKYRCLIEAADCLNFRKAAEKLQISPSVLSRHIASLESQLDMALFVRDKRRVALTPAGELLAAELKPLITGIERSITRARELQGKASNRVRIGTVVGQRYCGCFARIVYEFQKEHPEVVVDLSFHTIAELREAVLDGSVDFASTAGFEVVDDDRFSYIEMDKSKSYLVISRNHPLASRENLSLDDFKDDLFLQLAEKESPQIARSLRLANVEPRTLIVPDISALSLCIEAEFGIAMLNEHHALRDNPNMLFVDVHDFPDTIEVLAWKKDYKTSVTQTFIDFAKERCEKLFIA
jgi:DNA-binding transcriptional LysR family regulator